MKFQKVTGLIAISSLLALTACMNSTGIDNTNRPNDGKNTATGAIVGGLLGAFVGAKVTSNDDRGKGIIAGAIAGAAAGGSIGHKLDQQAEDLRQAMGNDQVRIENTGSELIVTMPQDILFAIDSAAVRPDLGRDLGALAQNLMAYPESTVQVIGHTDNTGSAEYNQGLSERRASSVAGVLRGNGVPDYRLRVIGQGESTPVADNLTDAGRAKNRRVEVVITPNA